MHVDNPLRSEIAFVFRICRRPRRGWKKAGIRRILARWWQGLAEEVGSVCSSTSRGDASSGGRILGREQMLRRCDGSNKCAASRRRSFDL